MIKKFIGILAVLFVSLTISNVVTAAEPAQTDDINAKTVRIYPLLDDGEFAGGRGSGFFIEGGRIVTNAHVVQTYTKFLIGDGAGSGFKAELVVKDDERDLAILKTDAAAADHVYFEIAEQSSEFIRLIGSAPGEEFTLKSGTVTMESTFVDIGTSARDRMWMDMTIVRGYSGGPVFNGSGDIVGVTVGGSYAQGSYAVRLDDLNAFLDANPAPVDVIEEEIQVNKRAWRPLKPWFS